MKHTNQIKECKCGYYFGGGVCQCKVHTSHFTCIPVSINEEIRTPLSTDNLPCGCPKKDEYSRCIQQSHLADKEGNCIDAPHGSRSTNCPVHCRRATDKPSENAVKLHPCASNTIVNQLSSEESVIVKSDTPKSKSGKDIDVPTKSEAQEAVTRAEEALRDNPKVYEDHLSKSEDVESREFYELMQLYRHAPLGEQKAVTGAYEAVKSYISSLLKDRERQSRDDALMEAGNIALEEEAYQAYHAIEELRTSISSKYKVKEGKE